MNLASAAGSRRLEARWGLPRVLDCVRVTSTMDLAHALVHEGAPDHSLILADEQVAGRGRRGAAWASPAGGGLWMAWITSLPAASSHLISLRTGSVLCQTLIDLGAAATIKWPNDIMLDDRKLAGILCEGVATPGGGARAIVGIGVNLRSPVAEHLKGIATTLDEHMGDTSPTDLLDELIPRLKQLSGEPELDELEHRWLAQHDWLRNRRVTSPAVGVVSGIARDGALLINTSHSSERCFSGTVILA